MEKKLPTSLFSGPDRHFFFFRWTSFVFSWYNHLATIFVSSIGLEDIITHIEALTKFTQQALIDSWQNLSLLNTECL